MRAGARGGTPRTAAGCRTASAVRPGQPQALSVTYWGSDSGARVFDVLVDGRVVATERLDNNRPGPVLRSRLPDSGRYS